MKIQLNFIENKGLCTFAIMNLLRKLLLPLVPLYYLGAFFNKKLYDWGLKASKSFDFPVITVGNLSVGGTGKSPMVAYITSLLYNEINIATLSRGYKRKSKGFKLVTKESMALEVGDEPLQFKLNFPEITVAVDADRKNGITKLINSNTDIELVLLDDAFQHRKVKAGLQILLTAYGNLYCNDMLLPTGDLREPRSAANRADVIVVTKCPQEISFNEMNAISKSLKPKSDQKVFFSYIAYDNQVFGDNSRESLKDYLRKKFTLITGIANPKPLVKFLRKNKGNFNHISFPDHHNFTDKELERIAEEDRILTTEKDFMRLCNIVSLKNKLMYLPIRCAFIEKGKEFDDIIQSYVKNKTS